MRTVGQNLAILLIIFILPGADAREIRAEWDNRCEECHGEADEFARKFLWAIDGQLQGQHHIDNLRLYLRNHYIPKHLIDEIYNMLLAQANSPVRFKSECSSCHNSAEEFIKRAIFIKAGELTGVESGIPVREFLKTHQRLQQTDVDFFTKLLTRVLNDTYRS
ncbi:MAG: hypothetical protein ACERLB_14510 [Gammaproteobacteria bacterium]